jgi:6-phosphogluconate dehydrogenase
MILKTKQKPKVPVNGHRKWPWIWLGPIPTIDTSVSMRDLSKYKHLREKASTLYGSEVELAGDKDELLVALEQAFYFTS